MYHHQNLESSDEHFLTNVRSTLLDNRSQFDSQIRDSERDIDGQLNQKTVPGIHFLSKTSGAYSSHRDPPDSTLRYSGNDGRSANSPANGIIRTWWLEISSCVAALLTFAAMVVMLYSHQGKPLPKWPWRTTINSVLSILSVSFKGAILLVVAEGLSQLKWTWITKSRPLTDISAFENAARGPFGALKFLFVSRIPSLIALLGAGITVLALGVDPFAQQLIRYEPCLFNSSLGSATLPRTNAYDNEIYWANTNGVPIDLQTAIILGLYEPARTAIVPICPTRDCIFPDKFHTVGYCGTCSDITNKLDVVAWNYTWSNQFYNPLDQANHTYHESMIAYNITIPTADSHSLKFQNFGGSTKPQQNEPNAAINATSFVVTTPYFPTVPIEADFVWMLMTGNLSGDASSNSSSWKFGPVPLSPRWNNTEGYGAANCSFKPCVRTYSASVVNNTFSETYDGKPFFPTMQKYSTGHAAAIHIPSLTVEQRQILLGANYIIPKGAEWMDYTIDPKSGHGILGSDDLSCIYSFYISNHVHILTFLSDFLSGSVTPGVDGVNYGGPSTQFKIFNQGHITFDDVQKTVDQVSSSITNYIRVHGNPKWSEGAAGFAQQQQTCVNVYWWWITYSAILLILTFIFFLSMLSLTRNGGDWKSSVLPLLPESLWGDEGCFSQQGRLLPLEDIQKSAERIIVQIDAVGKGWRFEKLG